MRFTNYQPWAPIQQIQREFDRVRGQQSELDSTANSTWIPVVDITENDDSWVLLAEVPGVKPEEIEITAEDGYLVIQGEKSLNREENDKGRHHSERLNGRFYRRFSLPKTADTQNITATSEHGVLSLRIPKQAEKQPRRIQIEAA